MCETIRIFVGVLWDAIFFEKKIVGKNGGGTNIGRGVRKFSGKFRGGLGKIGEGVRHFKVVRNFLFLENTPIGNIFF